MDDFEVEQERLERVPKPEPESQKHFHPTGSGNISQIDHLFPSKAVRQQFRHLSLGLRVIPTEKQVMCPMSKPCWVGERKSEGGVHLLVALART